MVTKSNINAELQDEITNQKLEVTGVIPNWLSGTLIRNGPVNISIDGRRQAHWFDGLAMLHAFSFNGGEVVYTNRFLRTEAYHKVFDEGSLSYVGFAQDPCCSIFKQLFTWFIPRSSELHNANVNVAKLADQYVALTEIPLPVRFDPETLETLGVLDYDDSLPKDNSWESAHPHQGLKGTLNYLVKFGRRSYYTLYLIEEGFKERKVIGEIPVDKPSYMHSFSITENYAVFTEYPFVVKPLDLIINKKPFIKNYSWKPEQGTTFLVVNRHDGQVVGKYKTDPFFAFHHVNAFEKDERIVLDLVRYEDAEIIMSNYFRPNQAVSNEFSEKVVRYSIDLQKEEIKSETLFELPSEFPRINPAYDGKPYRFVYLTDPRQIHQRSNEDIRPLHKLDVESKQVCQWSEKGCYPGEPVFVQTPNAFEEDEGIILTVVMDQPNHCSFLLVLNGKTFQEIGRARIKHQIPAGLHGQYFYLPSPSFH